MQIKTIAMDVLRDSDVVRSVKRRQQIKSLKDEPDFVAAQPGALGIIDNRKVIAVYKNSPSRCPRQSPNHVQQCGFAAARWTHYSDEFAGKNVEVNTPQCRKFNFSGVIGLPKTLGLQYWFHTGSRCSRPGG